MPSTERERPGMRAFPMQDGPPIPWFLAEVIYEHVYRFRSQTLEHLAKRGGFGWDEVGSLWTDRKRQWRTTDGHRRLAREAAERAFEALAPACEPGGDEPAAWCACGAGVGANAIQCADCTFLLQDEVRRLRASAPGGDDRKTESICHPAPGGDEIVEPDWNHAADLPAPGGGDGSTMQDSAYSGGDGLAELLTSDEAAEALRESLETWPQPHDTWCVGWHPRSEAFAIYDLRDEGGHVVEDGFADVADAARSIATSRARARLEAVAARLSSTTKERGDAAA